VSRIHRKAALLGLATTLVLCALFLLGAFEGWERKTIDLRFTFGRIQHEPMASDIVHVDIDDGAIDAIGRWPWPRWRLADAITEMGRAGARVVVLDILFEEPSDDPEDDTRLADAMARTPTVLAVRTGQEWELDETWRTPEGEAERRQLSDVLCKEISIDPEDAAREVGLSSDRLQRFLTRANMFKQVAVWERLRDRMQSDDPPQTFDGFMREISPEYARGIQIPHLSTVRVAWDRYQAWDAVEDALKGDWSGALSHDLPPIAALAEHAAAVGFVDADADPDGTIRWTRVSRRLPSGMAPPLGVAAFLAYVRLNPREFNDALDEFYAGDRLLPLERGELWLYWPTSSTDPRWEGLLRQFPNDPPTAGHVSISVPIELAEHRTRLMEQRAERRRIAAGMLGRQTLSEEEMTEELLAAVREEIEWQLESFPADVAPETLDETARRVYEDGHKYALLEETIHGLEEFIPSLEGQLRRHLHGKLVFVGYTFTASITDRYPTAVGATTPGVVVHAVVADMCLRGRGVSFLPFPMRVLITFLVGVIGTLLAVRFTGVLSGLLTVVVLSIYVLFGGLWLFDYTATIVPLAGPLTTGVSAWLVCTAFEAAMYQRDRTRITRQFKARVSGQLVDFLIENPAAVSMSGDERDVTVLFCDLQNFTAISEKIGGKPTVALLNRYMGRLTELIIEQRGYVNKFLGDGLMAFWSAFAYDADQASHACRAVIECQRALRELNEHPDFKDFPNLDMRAGITTGRVIVGDCGAPPHLNDYTVIGDAVNLAARLEAANKQFGTNILIDRETRTLVQSEPEICTRFLGRIAVVGQSRPVVVYELLASPCDAGDIELSERAARAFMDGEIVESERLWEEYVTQYGSRPFADLYLEALSREGPAASGVLILQSK